ncbi:MAG: MBL fold metallo-hydrolase [Chitinophagaceae bacterium]
MSLFIASLNSGSNGNCYYVGNNTEAVLIDAGISCRETEIRVKRLGLSMSTVKAIFISHEHTDHISGVRVLSKKYQLPVYITAATLRSAGVITEKHLVRHFNAGQLITIDVLSVMAFPKCHDANDPHSFMISSNGINIGVFTDIGNCCDHVIANFKKCHAVFLEANYCEDMLMNGSYPYILKKRISSDNGHLSNGQALELFTKHRGHQLSHLVLSHLSKNNNRPELVDQLFRQQAGSTNIVVASRNEETAVYCIEQNYNETFHSKENYLPPKPLQLSLF